MPRWFMFSWFLNCSLVYVSLSFQQMEVLAAESKQEMKAFHVISGHRDDGVGELFGFSLQEKLKVKAFLPSSYRPRVSPGTSQASRDHFRPRSEGALNCGWPHMCTSWLTLLGGKSQPLSLERHFLGQQLLKHLLQPCSAKLFSLSRSVLQHHAFWYKDAKNVFGKTTYPIRDNHI